MQVELKQLKTRLSQCEKEIKDIQDRKVELDKELQLKVNAKKNLLKQISNLTTRELIISEHAILRYFERVNNTDIEKIKKEMVDLDTIGRIKVLGDGIYPIKDYKIVVRNNTVVTIE